MKEQELLETFLSGLPQNYRQIDIERFVAYSIANIRAGKDFDTKTIQDSFVPEEVVEVYRFAYICVAEVLRQLHLKPGSIQ